MSEWPWWLLLAIAVALYIVYLIITDVQMQKTFWFISGQTPEALSGGEILFKGLAITLTVTIIAYSLSLIIGLVFGLMRSSTNVVLYNIASMYVEIVRGIPMLVLLLYIAFALTPLAVELLNWLGLPISTRDVPGIARAVIALAIGYGAFTAEIFRAGIQSIEKGQFEAAAPGYELLPNHAPDHPAPSRAPHSPALGNDFIAGMVKDSSLVAILGVQDLRNSPASTTAATSSTCSR